jgi:hypothetical protein
MPQQRPSSVPQQHFVGRWAAETGVPFSAQPINWGNNPASPRLTVRLAVTNDRIIWQVQRIRPIYLVAQLMPIEGLKSHILGRLAEMKDGQKNP